MSAFLQYGYSFIPTCKIYLNLWCVHHLLVGQQRVLNHPIERAWVTVHVIITVMVMCSLVWESSSTCDVIKRVCVCFCFVLQAQQIEMQRRVRRPFARIKTVVEKTVAVDTKQSASYVSVEMCRDGRAAILTVLVRLPGDPASGHPTLNRTGVCFGSTLVKMNSKPKDSKKKKDGHHRTSNETDTSSST